MYAEMDMIGEPSCGAGVVAETWSLRCLSACMIVAFLDGYLQSAMFMPADRRFVVESSMGDMRINLYFL